MDLGMTERVKPLVEKVRRMVEENKLDPAQIKSGELMLADPDNGEDMPMWVTCTEIHDELGSVTTVDGVSGPAGRLAGVLALARAEEHPGGSYGASGADGLLPLG